MNRLYHGDNLTILRNMPDNSVDLIATDPPFNTGRNYGAFNDKWGGLKGYLKFMEPRCVEMHRVLKDTGSFYLHCDPTASHYLKVMLDGVFGIKQFRAEIIWKRHNSHSCKLYGNIHDVIFYYGFGKEVIPDNVRVPLSKERIKAYSHTDEFGAFESSPLSGSGSVKVGQYTTSDLMGSGNRNGQSGKAWKGILPPPNSHWAVPIKSKYAQYIEKHFIPNYTKVKNLHKRLDLLDEAGLIYWTKNGKPRLKRYLSASVGKPPQSIWDDIPKARGGYPTQKPLALYERIIKASSNEGDLVLDPFAGSGTTLDAAQSLNRKWIGIDQSLEAIQTIVKRMEERHGMLLECQVLSE